MIDPSNLFILITILVIAILSGRLLSPHITRVFTLAPSRLDKILNPVERGIFRLVGVDPARGMGWKEYFLAAVIVNIFQMAIAFVIFSVQGVLPLNPQGFPGLSWDLAFMQVISFATNTNLQHYNGEGNCVQLPNCSNLTGVPGLSYLSQMMAVQFLQFTSAARLSP
ncbi:potassium-transporting ATPase subunit KdpA [Candidatus Bathyarchaeota archaeon]|nr:MAG: potassium-transporting ATPase subunit KdpA [Candidatus Bathyarchaeota archaeon]